MTRPNASRMESVCKGLGARASRTRQVDTPRWLPDLAESRRLIHLGLVRLRVDPEPNVAIEGSGVREPSPTDTTEE